MHEPTFSVVTVCFNAKDTIIETVESVRVQVHSDYEHLIVDGGSTDGTLAVLDSANHPRIRVLSEPDNGIYDAMNKGANLARGRYLIFLNADDRFASNAALSSISELTKSKPDLACWPIRFFTARADSRRTGVWYPPSSYPRLAAMGLVPPHPGTAVLATRFRELGGFRTEYSISADFDFFCRLARLHPTVTVSHEVLVNMRIGGISTGSVRGTLQGIRESVSSATRNYGWIGLLAVLKPLYKLRQFTVRRTPL